MSEELKPLSKKDLATLAEYLKTWNGTRAWMSTHPKCSYNAAKAKASLWLTKDNVKAAIADKLSELHMGVDEALQRETEIGRTGVGFFFKISDEWMFNPLPEYEILDEKEVIEEDESGEQIKRICYRVRHAVLDMDKVMDPQYAYMVKKFSNSRRNGLSIEVADGQASRVNTLKMKGLFTEHIDLTSKGEQLNPAEMKPSEIAARVAALLKQGQNDTNGS